MAAAEKIAAAAPDAPAVKPAKPRRVLVLTESAAALEGARKLFDRRLVPHESAPYCAHAVAELGRKTGAFGAIVATDAAVFTPEKLREFDAIVLANVYLDKELYGVPVAEGAGRNKKTGVLRPLYLQEDEEPVFAARRKAFEDFVRSGKGLVGIHNAAAAGLGWPEYNAIIGGTHYGHAWWKHETVPVKLDDPEHPLNRAFDGRGFDVQDDIYYFTTPYSRKNLRVLLSVDTARAPDTMTDDRPDGDYPISWVKTYGHGRVFYTSLGHRSETFQMAPFLKHLLDGIQYALGDLKADASGGEPLPPRPSHRAMPGWRPLFDGANLDAWNTHKPSWRVEDGLVRFNAGKGGFHSRDRFTDYDLRVDFRLPCGSDSWVMVKRGIQVNIWDRHVGSGQLWGVRLPEVDGKPQSTDPTSRQDRMTGEWNTFLLRVENNRLRTVLNGIEVMNVLLPKSKRDYNQPISLQNHGEPMEFKHIYVRPIGDS
jgi:hypothetical protein